ncbi:hypothetical protein CDD83_6897 [Cordyceps sp. RAO-2017]|nr:hypothetical protein CDD83_6897 [Cordyceps sp. RAO-2017]
MLELERAYMIERLQANNPPRPRHPGHPSLKPSALLSRDSRSPESPSIQHRRAEMRSPPPARDGRGSVSPLVINTTTSTAAPGTPSQRPGESPATDDAPTAVATPVEKISPSVVTRSLSAKETDQRSICVSPSWEAHGRRRKEKKMEKKEKEEAARNAQQARGRKGRLSKQPPPASSTEALKKAEVAAPDWNLSRGRTHDRSTSDAAPTSTPAGKDATPRKPRSRSSSFVSLIRAPLGFRRSSVEQAPESEFIGGMKLELERQLANERALDQQAKADEAVVQPAPRYDRTNTRWSAPTNGLPSPRDAKDPSRKTYPPITRYENGTRSRSLVSPTAPAIPDIGKLDKWRARVGLKSPSQPGTPSTEQDMHIGDDAGDDGEDGGVLTTHHASGGLADDGAEDRGGAAPAHAPAAEANAWPPRRSSHAPCGNVRQPRESGAELDSGRGFSRNGAVRPASSGRSGPSAEYRTAPSTPPEPPRRSPRRGTLTEGSAPPLPFPTEATEASSSAIRPDLLVTSPTAPRREGGGAPAAPLETRSAMPPTPTRTAKRLSFVPSGQVSPRSGAEPRPCSPTSKPAEAAQRKSSAEPASPVQPPKTRPGSSSDDSGSEEFHSPSAPSTPATSRSESEKGLPPLGAAKAQNFSLDSSATEATQHSGARGSKGSETTQERNIDAIQAAADKVLATYRDATAAGGDGEGRRESDSSAAGARSHLPLPVQQPLRLMDKGGQEPRSARGSLASGGQAWRQGQARELSPWPAPAAYLEEARRLPPAGRPPARASRPRLGPPASFSLPGDSASPTNRSEVSPRSSDGSRYMIQGALPGLGPVQREPIAKVFVECCRCKFYHDMPSNLYEAMANPEAVLSGRDTMGYAGAISMTVKCPWCRHEMSTRCCAGLAALVYVTERLH